MASLGGHEERALAAMEAGEKALKRWSLFSSSDKFSDAAEAFNRAGNSFKLAKKWEEAGEAYARCAELHLKLKSPHDAASSYVDAAAAYKKVSPSDAIAFYQQAIEQHLEMGSFTTAAKLTKAVAELHEGEGNMEEAVDAYSQAASLYGDEDSLSASNQCKNKVAVISATLGRYTDSAELFEEIGASCLEVNLLKFNAKGYFLNAAICLLCTGDTVATRKALDRFESLDFSWSASREAKFAVAVTDAAEGALGGMGEGEEGGVSAFSSVVYEYDSVSTLSPWMTSQLLVVRKLLEAAAEDEGPDLT
eukprot:PLAT4716.1.p2 GENE.PLAT4716.1~~PLAT4716.1.p2  ORF type:complete len:306 (+),score=151.52 PLAT4716.1:40-957(+)